MVLTVDDSSAKTGDADQYMRIDGKKKTNGKEIVSASQVVKYS
jgi:hypothetical protein